MNNQILVEILKGPTELKKMKLGLGNSRSKPIDHCIITSVITYSQLYFQRMSMVKEKLRKLSFKRF